MWYDCAVKGQSIWRDRTTLRYCSDETCLPNTEHACARHVTPPPSVRPTAVMPTTPTLPTYRPTHPPASLPNLTY
jgi:hypothetical protein